jgi:hypothetical protein
LAEHTSALAAALQSELQAADPSNSCLQWQQQDSSKQLPSLGTFVPVDGMPVGLDAWAVNNQGNPVGQASSSYTSLVPAACKPMFAEMNMQTGRNTLQLLQQQQQVCPGMYGSSPQQNVGILNMLSARQGPDMRFISDTPSLELEELLLPGELTSSSVPSMPARCAPAQQQQQLGQGSFLQGPVMVSGSSINGHDSSSSCSNAVGAVSNNSSPFLAAAYQPTPLAQQLPPFAGQQQQQQQQLLQDLSTSLSSDMFSAGAWQHESELASRTGSIPIGGALAGAVAMPHAFSGSSSSRCTSAQQQQQWQGAASPQQEQQQQQYQKGQGSSPLPGIDPALLDLQRQLAAVSLTADLAFAPAAAAAGGSCSRVPVLLQSVESSASNSEALAGTSPPVPGSPLCNVIDEEIMRLLKVSRLNNAGLLCGTPTCNKQHVCCIP